MAIKKLFYPGTEAAELEKSKAAKKRYIDNAPDFIPGTVIPNYDKFRGMNAEKVLAYLNID